MNQPWLRILPAPIRSRLVGRPYLQQVMGNSAFLVIDRILRLGVGLVVGVWIARYLGPDRFGIFNYAVAFAALFAAFATMGLDTIVVRELLAAPERRGEILGSAFLLKLVGALFAVAMALGAIVMVRPGDTLVLGLVAVSAAGMIFQAFDTIDLWFQSQVLSKLTVYAKGSAFALVTVAKVTLILLNAPLIAFAIAGTTEIALGAMGLVLAYRLSRERLRSWRPAFARLKCLLKDCWPLIFSNLVIIIYMRIDQVMLGQMASDREVGIYSAAVRLAESWYFIPTALASSVFPSIIKAKETSEALFYERLQRFYGMMALIAYAVAIPTTLLSGLAVRVIYGPEYAAAAPMLVVLIWAGLFTSLGVARSSFLMAMNWTKLHLVTVLFGGLINIGLNCLWIPAFGGMGAATASLVAYWFAGHGSCLIYRPLWKTGLMLTRAIVKPRI